MSYRISRKSKKWHKKNGWVLHFTASGEAYFSRTYKPFKLSRNIYDL